MKKGFTLVELLAVVVILSVISMLVFPNVIKIINQSKKNLYQTQIRDLENVAKNFSMEHSDLLDVNRINATYVTLDALKQSGYLEVDKINNPKTSQEMNGCVKIEYNESTQQYNYNYEEITCSEDQTLQGYIITYQNGLQKEERNVSLSAYEKILSDYNGLISSLGGVTDGLYDIDDEYIFRGSNPNNYVKLGSVGDSYRIISMNKKDKSIKLIKVTPESSVYSTDNSNAFIESSISTYLLNFITSESMKEFYSKIVDGTKWKNGILDVNTSIDYPVLKSVEATSSLSNKMGLIQVSDYIIASLDDTCYNDVMSTTCQANNYLATLFGSSSVWTMGESTNGYVITIENGTITNHLLDDTTDSTYRIYPTFYLKRSVSIVSGTGTSTSPYIIE